MDPIDTIKHATRERSRTMPSKSPKQARTMAAAAHNPQFAKKVGIPQETARDFNKADAGSQQLKDAMKNRKLSGRR